jgi:hypothetical protein
VLPAWFTCVVLSGYFPCKVSIDSNVEDENDVMVDMRLLDNVDYVVVMACCYIIYYLSYLCMFSIGY